MSSKDEAEIRKVIERWVKAVSARDLDGVVAGHSENMVMFDVPPPSELRGISAYKESWGPFFKWQREHDGVFELVSLNVTAGVDAAFAHALLICTSRQELPINPDSYLRLTVGLIKRDDRWQIAHEHHSFALAS